jgi:magnesium-transporting ATPase (P-type)
MLCLSICHSVFTKEPETENEKTILYQASSPDELSLVSASRYFGFTFMKREIGDEVIIRIKNENLTYKVTHILEYSSERKRMSVIVKTPEGKIYLLCKGADSIVKQIISQNPSMVSTTEDFLTGFANAGLRTLMIAYKELNQNEYQEFDKKYQLERNNDNKSINELYDSIEKDLYLLGSTGIEDQLQEDLAKTLYSFIEIDIKIWVLTGDKVGTAISIAYSCNLLTRDFDIIEFKEDSTGREIEMSMQNFLEKVKQNGTKKLGLVICSGELSKILANKTLTTMVFYI